jgi:hypothetical protein
MSVLDYYTFIIYLIIREFDSSSFVLLTYNTFGYSGLFVAPCEFFSIYVKNAIRVLIVISSNL